MTDNTEWFWRIVDAAGLNNVSSDEETALRELVARAGKYESAENARAAASERIARAAKILDDIDAQIDVSNRYARENARDDAPTVWEIQNAHIRDRVREIRAALT